MKLFNFLHSPAKRYARELGPWLRKNWGASEHYTEGQIRRAVRELRLDQRSIVFGYAAFMREPEFNALSGQMPIKLSYMDARAKLTRFVPPQVWSSGGGVSISDPVEVASGMDFHSH